jgi:hypothetical protein
MAEHGSAWQRRARAPPSPRHHCRVCGLIFCSDCLLRQLPYFEPLELAPQAGDDFRNQVGAAQGRSEQAGRGSKQFTALTRTE